MRRILSDKQVQNNERYAALRKLAAEQVRLATLVVDGQELEIGGMEAQARLVRGFHELLVRTYPNLRMLRGLPYSENDIGRYLRPEVTLYGDDSATVGEAEAELLALIQGNQRSGLRTTLQALVNRFERKPYGWYLAAIQCTLARLCARGKVEARRDGTLLENQTLEHALRNTRGFDNVLLDPQIDFTAAQVRRLKEFYADFFDGPPHANEAKALGQETAAAFLTLQQEIAQLHGEVATFPFLSALAEPAVRVQAVTGKPYAFYLTDLSEHADGLFDAKEKVLDPIRRFMRGSQKQIYGEARRSLAAQEPNLPYVDGSEAQQLQAILDDPACFAGSQMTRAKTLLDALQVKVNACVRLERTAAGNKVDERWERLASMAEYADLTVVQQAELRRPFDELKRTIERQTLVAVVRDTLRRFDSDDYSKHLAQMAAWSAQAHTKAVDDRGADGEKKIIEPRVEYVAQAGLKVPFDKAWLADEADVDAYLAALKAAMMTVIEAGKRVQV